MILIFPYKQSLGVLRLIINKISNIDVTIHVLHSIAMLTVILKRPLVESKPLGFIDLQTFSMKQRVGVLPKIECLCSFDEAALVIIAG